IASGGGARLRYAIVGDFNKDDRLDIIIANYGTNNIGALFGFGNGTFENQIMLTNSSNYHPSSIAFGDFNIDTQMDIVIANFGDNNLGVIFGCGNGPFSAQLTYSTNY